MSGPWDNSAWVSPIVSASLSSCSTSDNRPLIPIFFLIISQDVTSSGSRALFFLPLYLMAAAQCHCQSSMTLTSWHLAPFTLLYSVRSQTVHCRQSLSITCSVCLLLSTVPTLVLLGSVPKLAPLPDVWDEAPGFRRSGSLVPEVPGFRWSLSDLYGKKKKRPLLSHPLNGLMDQEWGVDRDWFARCTVVAQREE